MKLTRFDLKAYKPPALLENTMIKVTKNKCNMIELELEVLRQRYELARDEVITRMKARYTVVAFLLTFISASVGFVSISRVFEYGFIAELVLFSGVIFLMVESWRILQLDSYLSSIQTRISSLLQLELNGWETYLRKMKKGRRPNKWLLVGFVARARLRQEFHWRLFSTK